MKIIITGGAGFIGSHVVRLFVTKYPDYQILNLDALTYAGNLENLRDIENAPNYRFVKGDIADQAVRRSAVRPRGARRRNSPRRRVARRPLHYRPDGVCENQRDRHGEPAERGPQPLAARLAMKATLFYHVSTDEVYGSLEMGPEMFTEETAYDPRSPYSASKASSDHFVRAWYHTYGLPVKLSNCSNNYGPNHFPEKLIPLAIHRIRTKQPVPVYGKGENVRDWLFVKDHATAIDAVFHKGKKGETYNIGGVNEWQNLELIRACSATWWTRKPARSKAPPASSSRS